MGVVSKAVKYGTIFIIGYYLGAGGCSDYQKQNNLEKKVTEEYNGGISKDSE